MILTVCVCVIFPSVRVAIENANASHMHPAHVAFYQVYGTCNLVTFKGVYGTVWDRERTAYAWQEMHFGQKWTWTRTHAADITQMWRIRSKGVCLLLFYILATSNVISGWASTCDSVGDIGLLCFCLISQCGSTMKSIKYVGTQSDMTLDLAKM